MKKGYTIDTVDITVRYFCEDFGLDILSDNCHDRYEIVYAISPLGTCSVEGSEYALGPRALLLIPPLSFHAHTLDFGTTPEGYSVSFRRDALNERVLPMLDKITSGGENVGRYYSPASVCDALSDIFRRFDDASVLSDEQRSVFLEMLISEIVIFLSASEGKSISHTDSDLGARVAKYLNSNIEKSISLDHLATRFFVSKYHLCRAFKKYSGTSVHSYINQKRIMYAKQLIESGETASVAAERVGFGDYSAFYRAYIRIVGKSPTK